MSETGPELRLLHNINQFKLDINKTGDFSRWMDARSVNNTIYRIENYLLLNYNLIVINEA